MKLTRRDALALGLGATAASFLPLPAFAATSDEVVASFTGGAAVGSGGVARCVCRAGTPSRQVPHPLLPWSDAASSLPRRWPANTYGGG